MSFIYRVRRSFSMRSEPKGAVKRSLLIQIASLYKFETSRRPKWLKTPKRLPRSLRIGLRRPVKMPWLCRIRIWRSLCTYSAPSTWRASSIRDRIETMSIDFPVRKRPITRVSHYTGAWLIQLMLAFINSMTRSIKSSSKSVLKVY
jgi:hypothetical protein